MGNPETDVFDHGYLPAAEERVGRMVPIASKALAGAERKVVDDAGGEVVVEIDLGKRPVQFAPIGQGGSR